MSGLTSSSPATETAVLTESRLWERLLVSMVMVGVTAGGGGGGWGAAHPAGIRGVAVRVVWRWRGGRGTAACFLSLSEASVLLSGLVAGGWWRWWRCSVQVGWRQETGRACWRAASLPWLPPPRPAAPPRRCGGVTDPGLASASTSQRSSQEVFNFRDGRGHSGVTLACTKLDPWTRWTRWTRSSRKVDKCAGTMTTDIQSVFSVQCPLLIC